MVMQGYVAEFYLNGKKHNQIFEGKGTTKKNVTEYLKGIGAKKIKLIRAYRAHWK